MESSRVLISTLVKNFLISLSAKSALLALLIVLATWMPQLSFESKVTPSTFKDFFETISEPCSMIVIVYVQIICVHLSTTKEVFIICLKDKEMKILAFWKLLLEEKTKTGYWVFLKICMKVYLAPIKEPRLSTKNQALLLLFTIGEVNSLLGNFNISFFANFTRTYQRKLKCTLCKWKWKHCFLYL